MFPEVLGTQHTLKVGYAGASVNWWLGYFAEFGLWTDKSGEQALNKYTELVTGLIDRKTDLCMKEDLKWRWTWGLYPQPKLKGPKLHHTERYNERHRSRQR